MEYVGILLLEMKLVSMKQCDDPESTRAGNDDMSEYVAMETDGMRALGSERADALSLTSLIAQSGTMQPPSCARSRGPHSIFFALSGASSLASGVMLAAWALAAREVDLGQLAAPWPEPPQNRQRLLSRRCLHSSAISWPSLPNLLDMSGVLEAEEDED